MFVDTKEPTFAEDRVLVDLSKPSLQALSHLLRHKELWPDGFEWDYRRCSTCAIGLSRELWDRKNIKRFTLMLDIELMLGIDLNDANHFFVESHYSRRIPKGDVTPEMVSDDIDHYLSTRG